MKLMYNFLYIEDNEYYLKKFMKVVNEYFQKRKIVVYWKAYSYIPDDIDISSFDACFFDIEIGESTTIELLKNNQLKIPIIFITQYSYYIHEIVHFHIFDYIMKPRLEEEIERTLQHLEKFYEYYNDEFVIKYNSDLYKIRIGEINYIKTLSHHTTIYKSNGEVLDIWKGFKQIFGNNYKSLTRIHKSYVVNLYNCRKIKDRYMYFVNSDEAIPISNRRYKEVRELFFNSILDI